MTRIRNKDAPGPGRTQTSLSHDRVARGLDKECRSHELMFWRRELASSEVSFPPFYELGNALIKANQDMKQEIYTVYALIDPRDHAVRSIGITEDIYRRMKAHLQETANMSK